MRRPLALIPITVVVAGTLQTQSTATALSSSNVEVPEGVGDRDEGAGAPVAAWMARWPVGNRLVAPNRCGIARWSCRCPGHQRDVLTGRETEVAGHLHRGEPEPLAVGEELADVEALLVLGERSEVEAVCSGTGGMP
jgi:hypothetical protein